MPIQKDLQSNEQEMPKLKSEKRLFWAWFYEPLKSKPVEFPCCSVAFICLINEFPSALPSHQRKLKVAVGLQWWPWPPQGSRGLCLSSILPALCVLRTEAMPGVNLEVTVWFLRIFSNSALPISKTIQKGVLDMVVRMIASQSFLCSHTYRPCPYLPFMGSTGGASSSFSVPAKFKNEDTREKSNRGVQSKC